MFKVSLNGHKKFFCYLTDQYLENEMNVYFW